jgi:hypothetical protein
VTDEPIVGTLTSGMVADLAAKQGWPKANSVEGCLVRDLADGWIVAINGHSEPVDCNPPGTMGWKVEPYHMTFWRNGWMAYDVRPFVERGVTQEYAITVGGPAIELELRELLTRLLAE